MLVAWLWMEKGASIQILTIQDFSSPILVFPEAQCLLPLPILTEKLTTYLLYEHW